MSMYSRFKQQYPVVVDVNAIRAKGVMVEDIVDEAKKHEGIGGLVTLSQLGGIPSAYIGAPSKQRWHDVRNVLRTKRLVR